MGRYGDKAYNLFMFPFEALVLHRFRKSILGMAGGKVLEVGAGTGVNFKYYDGKKIDELSVIELPSRDFSITDKVGSMKPDGIFEGTVEKLPFPDGYFDTVVFTLVFCSVADAAKGLGEIYRVLGEGGRILFIEHVLPRTRFARIAAEKANMAWNGFSNGCNINRETMESIEKAGFRLVDKTYARKGVFIKGAAEKRQ
ncbi:MAG: class I SAM-dependent methyltransferase [Clostridia bacterium]|nr:class I SAM-dependent methyltransferase [Clostridia bacterium]